MDTQEHQLRSGPGRRNTDNFYSKMIKITPYLTFIIVLIAVINLMLKGLNSVIIIGQKAAQLSTIVDQFQPTVVELKGEVSALRMQDSTAIYLIRSAEQRDSAQLVELKRTVKAVNNLAQTIKNQK